MTRPDRLERQACVSLGGAPSFPCVWMAMQMKHGEHGHEVVFNGKEHAVRKITTRARRAPSSISGNWNGFSRTLANVVLTCASKRKPRSARSRSCRSAASKMSSSASDETSAATFSERYGGGPEALRGSRATGGR
jgi:hypothetical protein